MIAANRLMVGIKMNTKWNVTIRHNKEDIGD